MAIQKRINEYLELMVLDTSLCPAPCTQARIARTEGQGRGFRDGIVFWRIRRLKFPVEPVIRYKIQFISEKGRSPMLENVVADFTGGANTWNGIPTSCHVATLYWIYRDEFGQAPTQAQYVARLNNPTAIIRNMLPHGQALANAGAAIAAAAGSVIVFVGGGQPRHSCVKLAGNQIGGYNQLNWFTTPGQDHRYSTHAVANIKWRGGWFHGGQVELNVAGNYGTLVAIPQAFAKAILRQTVQG